ncbi:MAG: hypothetical protein ABII06_03620 [Pseudomonadota bacterium]
MNRNLGVQSIFEILTGICLVAVVVFFWPNPLWTSLLLLGILGMQLWFWGDRADAVIMLSAALLGTPSEMIAVKLKIWTYNAPGLFLGVPVWIPFVWAALFCFFRRIALTAHCALQKCWPGSSHPSQKIFFGLLGGIIVVYYFSIAPFISKKIILVYSLIFIPTAIFWHGGRDRLIFIIGAVIGTVGEYICIRLGFWHYHYPVFKSIGLPISLPMAWGLSAVINGRIAMIWEKNSFRGEP